VADGYIFFNILIEKSIVSGYAVYAADSIDKNRLTSGCMARSFDQANSIKYFPIALDYFKRSSPE